MIDPVLAYVAGVTTAIVLPLGMYLGALRERARAELRRPPAPHEALARVYEPTARVDYCNRCRGEVWGGELCRRCVPTAPADILAELRGPLGKGPACPTCGSVRYGNLFCDTCTAWHAENRDARPEVDA